MYVLHHVYVCYNVVVNVHVDIFFMKKIFHFRREAEGNINSWGSTKHTAYPMCLSQLVFYYIPRVKETKKQSELYTKVHERFY